MNGETPEEPELKPGGRDDEDDEGLFGRDANGQLLRRDDPTKEDYDTKYTVYVDGQPVTVRKAARQRDAQGNIIKKLDGSTIPRYTTIYDATVRLLRNQGLENDKNPIPVLCHQRHMTPVAVCRVCTVLCGKVITEAVPKKDGDAPGVTEKRSKLKMERRLTAACQRPVEDGMHIFTMNAKPVAGYIASEADVQRYVKDVRQAVEVIHELLKTDHLKPAPEHAKELNEFNELNRLGKNFKLETTHFTVLPRHATPDAAEIAAKSANASRHRPLDNSSPVFQVDHTACILCDRCSRACDEVKHNNVISRTGKGRTAGISFDLDDPMGKSSCVQCGECMVSCPTTAITFREAAKIDLSKPRPRTMKRIAIDLLTFRKPPPPLPGEPVTAIELAKDKQFATVPFKFLLWQEGLVKRRHFEPGETLCRQGQPGNSAFLIRSGVLEIVIWSKDETGKSVSRSQLRGIEDVSVGEMACLTGTPRTADVKAHTKCEVLEVRRNVLERIMRSPEERERFEKIYRQRSLAVVLSSCDLFKELPKPEYDACVDFLKDKLTFVRVDRGREIFKQGEFAEYMDLIRLGHVQVAIEGKGREPTILFRGPGAVIGEMGLLALALPDVPHDDAAVKALIAELTRKIGEDLNAATDLSAALPCGQRNATCSALDPLEMARVSRGDFLEMIKRFPTVRHRLVELSVLRLKGERVGFSTNFARRDFVAQGLYQAQNLLAIDLDKCTRCDECTKACVQQHGTESHGVKVTRLIRDGLRFGDYLVTTSCRSCKKPYCMDGCPVDSIHRGKHLQIVIEDHCIGCGLCASNCPYGNISMLPNEARTARMEVDDPDHADRTKWVARNKAAVCDLCDAEGKLDTPEPRCVYACPHDAAHRMSGEELQSKVLEAVERKKPAKPGKPV